MLGDQAEPPLVVHIEGGVKVGVSTVMRELSRIQPPGCNVHYMHEVTKHPFQQIVGDLSWNALRESHKGLGACLVELTAYLEQRYKAEIPEGTNMIVLDRSLGSLHKVFNSTKCVMILRELEDSLALNALYEALNTSLEQPHMVIYLHADRTSQENRIKQSDGYPITPEQLRDINRLYEKYLLSLNPKVHILRISTTTDPVDSTVIQAYLGIQELFLMEKISKYLCKNILYPFSFK